MRGFNPRGMSGTQVTDWHNNVFPSVPIPSRPLPVTLTPADIAGLAAWYDANDPSTFTYSSGVVVSQWRDKSGLGRHLNQATVANQPARDSSQNGLSTVRFDGSNDYLDSTTFTLPQPFTLFLSMDATPSSDPIWWGGVGGTLQVFTQPGSAFYLYAGTVQSTSVAFTGPHTWACFFNGAQSKAYKDGALFFTTNPGSAGTTTGLRFAERNLGGTGYIKGSLFEFFMYDRVLTDSERQQVEAYLRGKWALP